jgi:hypothetical protein
MIFKVAGESGAGKIFKADGARGVGKIFRWASYLVLTCDSVCNAKLKVCFYAMQLTAATYFNPLTSPLCGRTLSGHYYRYVHKNCILKIMINTNSLPYITNFYFLKT